MWYDNIINHQLSESNSEKMTHLVPVFVTIHLGKLQFTNLNGLVIMGRFPQSMPVLQNFLHGFDSNHFGIISLPSLKNLLTSPWSKKKAHPFQFPVTHLDYSKSDFSTAALTVALLPGRSAWVELTKWLTRLMWKKSWWIPLKKRRNGANFKTVGVKHLDVSSWKKLKHSNYINYRYYIGSFRFRSIHKC